MERKIQRGDIVTRDGRRPDWEVLVVYPKTMTLGEKITIEENGTKVEHVFTRSSRAKRDEWYIYDPAIAKQLLALDAEMEAIRSKIKPLVAQLKRCM